MSETLLPCPHCPQGEGEAFISAVTPEQWANMTRVTPPCTLHRVYCFECGHSTADASSEALAIDLWNRRDTSELEALREALETARDDLRMSRLNHVFAQNRINQHLADLDEMNHRAKAYADERDELRALVREMFDFCAVYGCNDAGDDIVIRLRQAAGLPIEG